MQRNMQEKKVIVILSTGERREHVLLVKDDNDYVKNIKYYLRVLSSDPKSVLGFTMPLCYYKAQNVIALEFADPPPTGLKPK